MSSSITFYKQFCSLPREDYNEYIKYAAPQSLTKFYNDFQNWDDWGDFIECYSVTLRNHRHNVCSYDVLWLIDDEEETIPVLLRDINTSSAYALWSLDVYGEHDIEEDGSIAVDERVSLDELVSGVKKNYRQSLREILERDYVTQ